MKKMSVLAALVCVFAACGASPCQKISDSLKRFSTKASKCTSGAKVRVVNMDTCNNQIGNCSAGDVSKLDTYGKCLDAVPECDPANPAAFKTAADACEQTADQFQLSCGGGLST
jgi:hypothetical protein